MMGQAYVHHTIYRSRFMCVCPDSMSYRSSLHRSRRETVEAMWWLSRQTRQVLRFCGIGHYPQNLPNSGTTFPPSLLLSFALSLPPSLSPFLSSKHWCVIQVHESSRPANYFTIPLWYWINCRIFFLPSLLVCLTQQYIPACYTGKHDPMQWPRKKRINWFPPSLPPFLSLKH